MCDYSLQNVASRPASVGDKLTTGKFPNTYSAGFQAPENKDMAVCVIPGTEIGFDDDIATRAMYGEEEKISIHRVAIFRQINTGSPYMHHDALELPDGKHVLVNDLKEGQAATVLQLPAAPKTETEAQEQTRLEAVG